MSRLDKARRQLAVAIELIAKVRRELQVPVPAAAMLGFPTVRGLAAQIQPADESE